MRGERQAGIFERQNEQNVLTDGLLEGVREREEPKMLARQVDVGVSVCISPGPTRNTTAFQNTWG